EPALTSEDRKLLNDLDVLIKEINGDMESYHFYLAAEKLYHYFWHTFADIIIEESKKRISEGTPKEKQSAQLMLFTILCTTIILLHPFMPFITEELWSMIKKDGSLLIVEKWPLNTVPRTSLQDSRRIT
ncbi:MAG: class I tRNA ligase family protein, partial [Patescibacteria group bacterium]